MQEKTKRSRYLFSIALALITLLGAGLRLIKLGDYPGGFGQDEAVDTYDAWSLLTTGAEHHGDRWPLNSRQFGDSPSTLPSYITMPFVALLGPTELAGRLPCALLNVAAIPLFGFLMLILFRSRAAALFGAGLLAVSPWNIFFSRWAVSPGFVTFFQVAGLLLMVRLYTAKAGRTRICGLAILTGVVLFLWTHQYLSQYFFAPLMIGAGFLLWSRECWPRIMVTGGVYSLCMSFTLLARVHDPSTAGRFHRESVFFTNHPLANFGHNYCDYQSLGFLFNAPAMLPLHQIPGVAHIPHLLAPFYLLGLGVLLAAVTIPKRLLMLLGRPDTPADIIHWRRISLWMLSGWVLAPITGAVFIQSMYTARMTHLLTLVVLITALGCAASWYLLKRLPMRLAAPVFALFLALYLGHATVKTVKGLVQNNLFFKGWLQQGVPEVMRYLGAQKHIRSVQFPRMCQGYIYHLMFTPVPPGQLRHAVVSRSPPDPASRWNYTLIADIGHYHFYPDMEPVEIAKTCLLRHQVRDRDRIWYDLYEREGDWYVLPHE